MSIISMLASLLQTKKQIARIERETRQLDKEMAEIMADLEADNDYVESELEKGFTAMARIDAQLERNNAYFDRKFNELFK